MAIRDQLVKAIDTGATLLRKFVEDKPEPPARRPTPGRYISGARYDYAPEAGKIGLDPEKLGRAMRAADSGDTRAMYEVFSAVEEDPHVMSVLGKRRRAVVSRTLSITPAKTMNGQAAAAERAAQLCNDAVFGASGESGIENLRGTGGALYDLTDAIGKGYAVQQIVWTDDRGMWRPKRLERWPQRDTVLGSIIDPWAQDCDVVRVVSDWSSFQGEDLEPNQWIVHKSKARSDILSRAALLRSVAWWYLFKRFSAADWAIFCERFGMPIRIGKFPVGSDDDEREALRAAVIDLGKDTGAVIPEGMDLSFVEAKMSGSLPYEPLIRICNTEISKVILGNTLTTEVGSTGGNRALGEVHERGELDLVESDALALADTLREQLIAPIVLFNMGPGVPIPDVDFLSEEERAQKDRAERDQILVRGIGLPIAKSYFYQSYEIPIPTDDDELVNPPQEHRTATEDLSDAQAEEIEQRAEESELTERDMAIVRNISVTLGKEAALEQIRLLASVKKKSQAWAL